MRNFSLFLLFGFLACAPKFNYLGDTYESKPGDVDVFYDIGDIERDFKVMGILTADTEQSIDKSTENLKKSMIDKAAAKGADGILFINIYTGGTSNNSSLVESKLIKYK